MRLNLLCVHSFSRSWFCIPLENVLFLLFYWNVSCIEKELLNDLLELKFETKYTKRMAVVVRHCQGNQHTTKIEFGTFWSTENWTFVASFKRFFNIQNLCLNLDPFSTGKSFSVCQRVANVRHHEEVATLFDLSIALTRKVCKGKMSMFVESTHILLVNAIQWAFKYYRFNSQLL